MSGGSSLRWACGRERGGGGEGGEGGYGVESHQRRRGWQWKERGGRAEALCPEYGGGSELGWRGTEAVGGASEGRGIVCVCVWKYIHT